MFSPSASLLLLVLLILSLECPFNLAPPLNIVIFLVPSLRPFFSSLYKVCWAVFILFLILFSSSYFRQHVLFLYFSDSTFFTFLDVLHFKSQLPATFLRQCSHFVLPSLFISLRPFPPSKLPPVFLFLNNECSVPVVNCSAEIRCTFSPCNPSGPPGCYQNSPLKSSA